MLMETLPPVLLFALQLVFIYFFFLNLSLQAALLPDRSSSQAPCLLCLLGLYFVQYSPSERRSSRESLVSTNPTKDRHTPRSDLFLLIMSVMVSMSAVQGAPRVQYSAEIKEERHPRSPGAERLRRCSTVPLADTSLKVGCSTQTWPCPFAALM